MIITGNSLLETHELIFEDNITSLLNFHFDFSLLAIYTRLCVANLHNLYCSYKNPMLTFDSGVRTPSTAGKLITPEDIENHNKEGGAWAIVQGKVYDFKALADKVPCGAEKLLTYTGQDATKAFEAIKHPDFTFEMARHCLVGTYSEVRKGVCAVYLFLLKPSHQPHCV